MPYKQGDRFVIEIESVYHDKRRGDLYRVKGFQTLVFDDYGLGRLKQANDRQTLQEQFQMGYAFGRMMRDFGTQQKLFDFGEAIRKLRTGSRVARKGWNGKGQYIALATDIEFKTMGGLTFFPKHERIGNSAIAFFGTSGIQMGWLASQADMLADDWYEVDEGGTEDGGNV